jgi:hypothetical protein
MSGRTGVAVQFVHSPAQFSSGNEGQKAGLAATFKSLTQCCSCSGEGV